jgi:hypothetical protein
MQIHHARRKARFSGEELVLLEDQDRSLWDLLEIAAGREALERAIALRGRGPYLLQAAIASLQADERIDWNEVAALYAQLAQIIGSPGLTPALPLRRERGHDAQAYPDFRSGRPAAVQPVPIGFPVAPATDRREALLTFSRTPRPRQKRLQAR